MCNAYGFNAPINVLERTLLSGRMPLAFDGGHVPNLEPRDLIRPTNSAPILRALEAGKPEAGLRLSEERWWLVPFFHRGAVKDWKAMCTNARSETIATAPTFREPFRHRRCLIPATHFFEWSLVDPARPKGPKQKWRITASDREIFYFAGLWDVSHPTDHEGPLTSFTLATCLHGPDMAPYHARQPVILDEDRGRAWLSLGSDGLELLRPGPAKSLTVRPAETDLFA